MKFKIYRSIKHLFTHHGKYKHEHKKLKTIDLYSEYIRVQKEKGHLDERNQSILLYELVWEKIGCPTIFITKEQATWFSGVGIEKFNVLAIPDRFHAFCVSIEGLEPVLVSSTTTIVCSCCGSRLMGIVVQYGIPGRGIMRNCVLQSCSKKRTLGGAAYREYAKELKSGEEFDQKHIEWPDAFRQSLRVAFGFMAYFSAFPNDAVLPGMPDRADVYNEPSVQKSFTVRSSRIMGYDKNKQSWSVVPHFRSGHFRTLISEKYKRNEDGTMRTVYVRQTFVHAEKVEPYHAIA